MATTNPMMTMDPMMNIRSHWGTFYPTYLLIEDDDDITGGEMGGGDYAGDDGDYAADDGGYAGGGD